MNAISEPLTFDSAMSEFHKRTDRQFIRLTLKSYLPMFAGYCRNRGWIELAEPIEIHVAMTFDSAANHMQFCNV